MNDLGINTTLHLLHIANQNRSRKVQSINAICVAAKRRANELAVARENARAGRVNG